MEIKRIISQNRRDFTADYECEHCNYINTDSYGYDDAYFHNTVIPAMKCPKCQKTSGDNYIPRTPKYPEGFQV